MYFSNIFAKTSEEFYFLPDNPTDLIESVSCSFITKRDKIVPAADAKFKSFDGVITEVILGPKSNVDKYVLEEFLMKNNIHIDINNIRSSVTSYR